ncbi:MAG: hypothetical protein COA90_08710 [Gammaproteobacteria bacterium]|nr:MAG: hypothetical protein COA90_08710 [Gammaproteobacteria bacterium]
MASAVNVDGQDIEYHELDIQQHDHDDLSEADDDTDCNHSCHISSHMIGLISSNTHLFATDNYSASFRSHIKTVSLVLKLRARPPKA